MVEPQRVEDPVIQLAVVLELQSAQRVRDALDGIRDAVRKVVQRIDAPFVPGAMMRRLQDAIQDRVTHDDVRRGHVDLGTQDPGAFVELAGPHASEQVQVLGDGTVPVWAVPAGLRQCAAIRANLLRGQVVHVRLAHLDQLLGVGIQLIKIVGCIVLAVAPVKPQPVDAIPHGLDVLGALLDRVRIIESQIAEPAKLLGDAEVQADRLRMAQLRVAVRFGRKPRVHAAAVLARPCVLCNDRADEIGRGCLCRHRRCPSVLARGEDRAALANYDTPFGGCRQPSGIPSAGRLG